MLLVVLLSLVFAVSCIVGDYGNNSQFPEPVGESAVDFVKEMGMGINIGNTLDCIGDANWIAGETGWGNPKITKELIKAYASYGYKTIRVPVTWAENLGPAPGYEIASAWMNRIDEVITWCLDEGLFVIVNLHHDGGASDKSWILNAGNDLAGTTKQFAAVWKQIARRFSGRSHRLIFEAMNEVGFRKTKQENYSILNSLNQTFVDTVRGTGAKNASRYLLISGYNTDIDQSCDALFNMPSDTINDRLILSIHYYTPAVFCIAETPSNNWGFRNDWGSAETIAADSNELNIQFNKLKTRFLNSGIPVILGEYGAVKNNHKIEEGRVRWMIAVTQVCLDNGICPVLWDTGGEISRKPPYRMSDSLAKVFQAIKSPAQ
jgi:endoglucanase